MLAFRLRNEIEKISSGLKKDLSTHLQEETSAFADQCEEIVSRYEAGASKPKDAEIYQAVYLFLKGRITEDLEYLYDLVAYGLYLPIEVLGDKYVAEDIRKLEFLLNRYSFEAYGNNLLRDTWFAVLNAYFHPSERGEEQDIMLEFLSETYGSTYSLSDYKPSWLKVLEYYPEILSKDPCRRIAEHLFNGNHDKINEIASSLRISDDSWFWTSLVRACVKFATNQPDDKFIQSIPNLLFMMDDTPDYLHEGVEAILYRYNQCETDEVQEELKSLSLSLWGNPRLRYSGESKWLNVNENVWRMVSEWVNEDYMRIFFERISERHEEKKPRLAAWLKYVEWARTVGQLGENTTMQRDPGLQDLFSMEEDVAFTQDHVSSKLDSFVDVITEYLSVQSV